LEISGDDLYGSDLKKKVEGIFERNQITPAVALEELQQLHERLQSLNNARDQCISAFRQLKIGAEQLKPGQAEIGILIPRKAVHNNLIAFAKELKEIEFILNTLAEVCTGKRGTVQTFHSPTAGLDPDWVLHIML